MKKRACDSTSSVSMMKGSEGSPQPTHTSSSTDKPTGAAAAAHRGRATGTPEPKRISLTAAPVALEDPSSFVGDRPASAITHTKPDDEMTLRIQGRHQQQQQRRPEGERINPRTGRPLKLRGWAKTLSYATVDLLLAVEQDDLKGVEQALADGADIDAVREGEGTNDSVLHRAARQPNSDVLLYLLHQEPKPHLVRNSNGETAVHLAARYSTGHVALPLLISAYGLESLTTIEEGDTVLHRLVRNTEMPLPTLLDVLSFLLRHHQGVRLMNVRNVDGDAVLDVASQRQMPGDGELHRLLFQFGARQRRQLDLTEQEALWQEERRTRSTLVLAEEDAANELWKWHCLTRGDLQLYLRHVRRRAKLCEKETQRRQDIQKEQVAGFSAYIWGFDHEMRIRSEIGQVMLEDASATRIQSLWKMLRARRDLAVKRLERDKATLIQRQYRTHRNKMLEQRRAGENEAAEKIQKLYRRHMTDRAEAKKQEQAAVVIQCAYRWQKKQLLFKRQEGEKNIKIQRWIDDATRGLREWAATTIQCKYKSHLQQRMYMDFLFKRTQIDLIQQTLQERLTMCRLRTHIDCLYEMRAKAKLKRTAICVSKLLWKEIFLSTLEKRRTRGKKPLVHPSNAKVFAEGIQWDEPDEMLSFFGELDYSTNPLKVLEKETGGPVQRIVDIVFNLVSSLAVLAGAISMVFYPRNKSTGISNMVDIAICGLLALRLIFVTRSLGLVLDVILVGTAIAASNTEQFGVVPIYLFFLLRIPFFLLPAMLRNHITASERNFFWRGTAVFCNAAGAAARNLAVVLPALIAVVGLAAYRVTEEGALLTTNGNILSSFVELLHHFSSTSRFFVLGMDTSASPSVDPFADQNIFPPQSNDTTSASSLPSAISSAVAPLVVDLLSALGVKIGLPRMRMHAEGVHVSLHDETLLEGTASSSRRMNDSGDSGGKLFIVRTPLFELSLVQIAVVLASFACILNAANTALRNAFHTEPSLHHIVKRTRYDNTFLAPKHEVFFPSLDTIPRSVDDLTAANKRQATSLLEEGKLPGGNQQRRLTAEDINRLEWEDDIIAAKEALEAATTDQWRRPGQCISALAPDAIPGSTVALYPVKRTLQRAEARERALEEASSIDSDELVEIPQQPMALAYVTYARDHSAFAGGMKTPRAIAVPASQAQLNSPAEGDQHPNPPALLVTEPSGPEERARIAAAPAPEATTPRHHIPAYSPPPAPPVVLMDERNIPRLSLPVRSPTSDAGKPQFPSLHNPLASQDRPEAEPELDTRGLLLGRRGAGRDVDSNGSVSSVVLSSTGLNTPTPSPQDESLEPSPLPPRPKGNEPVPPLRGLGTVAVAAGDGTGSQSSGKRSRSGGADSRSPQRRRQLMRSSSMRPPPLHHSLLWNVAQESDESNAVHDEQVVERLLKSSQPKTRFQRFVLRQWTGTAWLKEIHWILLVNLLLSVFLGSTPTDADGTRSFFHEASDGVEFAFSVFYLIELAVSLVVLPWRAVVFSHNYGISFLLRVYCGIVGFVPSWRPYASLRAIRLLEGWWYVFPVSKLHIVGIGYCLVLSVLTWAIGWIALIQLGERMHIESEFQAAIKASTFTAADFIDSGSGAAGGENENTMMPMELVATDENSGCGADKAECASFFALALVAPRSRYHHERAPVAFIAIVLFRYALLPLMLAFACHAFHQLGGVYCRIARHAVRRMRSEICAFVSHMTETEVWYKHHRLTTTLKPYFVAQAYHWYRTCRRKMRKVRMLSTRWVPLRLGLDSRFGSGKEDETHGEGGKTVSHGSLHQSHHRRREEDPSLPHWLVLSQPRFASCSVIAARKYADILRSHGKRGLGRARLYSLLVRSKVASARRMMPLHAINTILTLTSIASLWSSFAQHPHDVIGSKDTTTPLGIYLCVVHGLSSLLALFLVPFDATAVLTLVSVFVLAVSQVMQVAYGDDTYFYLRMISHLRLFQLRWPGFIFQRLQLSAQQVLRAVAIAATPFLTLGSAVLIAMSLRAQANSSDRLEAISDTSKKGLLVNQFETDKGVLYEIFNMWVLPLFGIIAFYAMWSTTRNRSGAQQLVSALLTIPHCGQQTKAVFKSGKWDWLLRFASLALIANLIFVSLADPRGIGFNTFYIVDFCFVIVALLETLFRTARSWLIWRTELMRRQTTFAEMRLLIFLFSFEVIDLIISLANFVLILTHTEGFTVVEQPYQQEAILTVRRRTAELHILGIVSSYLRSVRFLRLLRYVPYQLKHDLFTTSKGIKAFGAACMMCLYVALAAAIIVDSYYVESPLVVGARNTVTGGVDTAVPGLNTSTMTLSPAAGADNTTMTTNGTSSEVTDDRGTADLRQAFLAAMALVWRSTLSSALPNYVNTALRSTDSSSADTVVGGYSGGNLSLGTSGTVVHGETLDYSFRGYAVGNGTDRHGDRHRREKRLIIRRGSPTSFFPSVPPVGSSSNETDSNNSSSSRGSGGSGVDVDAQKTRGTVDYTFSLLVALSSVSASRAEEIVITVPWEANLTKVFQSNIYHTLLQQLVSRANISVPSEEGNFLMNTTTPRSRFPFVAVTMGATGELTLPLAFFVAALIGKLLLVTLFVYVAAVALHDALWSVRLLLFDLPPTARRLHTALMLGFTTPHIPWYRAARALEALQILHPAYQRHAYWLLRQTTLVADTFTQRKEQAECISESLSVHESGGPLWLGSLHSSSALAHYPPRLLTDEAVLNQRNPTVDMRKLVWAVAVRELQYPASTALEGKLWMDFLVAQHRVRAATTVQSVWRMYVCIRTTSAADVLPRRGDRVMLGYLRRRIVALRFSYQNRFRCYDSLKEAVRWNPPLSNPSDEHTAYVERIRGHYADLHPPPADRDRRVVVRQESQSPDPEALARHQNTHSSIGVSAERLGLQADPSTNKRGNGKEKTGAREENVLPAPASVPHRYSGVAMSPPPQDADPATAAAANAPRGSTDISAMNSSSSLSEEGVDEPEGEGLEHYRYQSLSGDQLTSEALPPAITSTAEDTAAERTQTPTQEEGPVVVRPSAAQERKMTEDDWSTSSNRSTEGSSSSSSSTNS